MEAKDIKSVDDVSNYIEGCLNDMEECLSTKEETSKNLHDLVAKVIDMALASLPSLPETGEKKERCEFSYIPGDDMEGSCINCGNPKVEH